MTKYQTKEQEMLNKVKTVSKLESLSPKEKVAIMKFYENKHLNMTTNF